MEAVPALKTRNPLVSLYVLQADGASVHDNVACPDCALQEKRNCLDALVRDACSAPCQLGARPWRGAADDHLNGHGI
jgi:hypothetical protein